MTALAAPHAQPRHLDRLSSGGRDRLRRIRPDRAEKMAGGHGHHSAKRDQVLQIGKTFAAFPEADGRWMDADGGGERIERPAAVATPRDEFGAKIPADALGIEPGLAAAPDIALHGSGAAGERVVAGREGRQAVRVGREPERADLSRRLEGHRQ